GRCRAPARTPRTKPHLNCRTRVGEPVRLRVMVSRAGRRRRRDVLVPFVGGDRVTCDRADPGDPPVEVRVPNARGCVGGSCGEYGAVGAECGCVLCISWSNECCEGRGGSWFADVVQSNGAVGGCSSQRPAVWAERYPVDVAGGAGDGWP